MSSQELYRSVDSADSWEKIELPTTVVATNMSIKNHTIYLSSNQGLYAYVDNSWIQVSTHQNLKYISINKANIIVVATENEIYRSQDNGSNWTILDTAGIAGRIRSLKINHNTIYVGTDRGFFVKNLF